MYTSGETPQGWAENCKECLSQQILEFAEC